MSPRPPGATSTSDAPEIIGLTGGGVLVREGSGPAPDTRATSPPAHRTSSPAHTERLLRITSAIANAVAAPEVYRALVDDVADAIGASSAGLWLLDEDGQTARLMRSRGYGTASEKSLETLSLGGSPALPILDCIRSGDPVWFVSQAALLERYPHLASMTTSGRRYRISALPLLSNGRVLGALGITIEETVPVAEEERDFLRLVALYASQAVERLRLLEAERRSREEAHALYGETREARTRAEQLYLFAQTVVAADRVEAVFDSALDAIQNALGARRSAILTYDDEAVMRFRAWRHLSETYRHAVEGHSPWSSDDPAPRPVLVPDALGDPSLAGYRSLFESEGIGALAFIPLVSQGRLLGKFMVYYDRPHVFESHEVETAQAIANHLGSVMTRFAAIARLEETIRSNELFAGALAHDLRNPLGAIMTAAQVALMQREGEEPRGARDARPLSRILSSGHRMANMIEQLLDFTRARSGGGFPIDPHEANLADLCAQAIGELELGHPEWTVERRSYGDLSGTWDVDRLLQVISNLVANAGQHGTPGTPIGVRADGTAHDHVTIEIHNQGAIPGSLLPHLFDPFRGTRYRRDQSQGLGLGLYIVREIVRAHGGSVSVHSKEEDGTTFRIELPRRSTRRRAATEALAAGPPLGTL